MTVPQDIHGWRHKQPITMKTRETMKRMIASTLMTGLLCVGSVTTWAAEPAQVSAPAPVSATGFMPGPGPGMAGGRAGSRCFSMKQSLGLSDKQDNRLRELSQAHFQEVAPLRQELFRMRSELDAESVRKNPDEKRISEIAGRMGQQQEKLAILESRHLRELSKVLNRKQIDTLLRMKDEHGFRRGGRWK